MLKKIRKAYNSAPNTPSSGTPPAAPATPATPEPSGTPAPATPEPDAKVKDIPWVQENIRKAAAYDKLLADRKAADEKAARDKLEAEGKYKEALLLAENSAKEANTRAEKAEVLAELKGLGLKDSRAIVLFMGPKLDGESDEAYKARCRKDGESAEEYAKRIKGDSKNALYFTDPAVPAPAPGRKAMQPPPVAGGSVPVTINNREHAEQLRNSEDPATRQAACAWIRADYRRRNGLPT